MWYKVNIYLKLFIILYLMDNYVLLKQNENLKYKCQTIKY